MFTYKKLQNAFELISASTSQSPDLTGKNPTKSFLQQLKDQKSFLLAAELISSPIAVDAANTSYATLPTADSSQKMDSRERGIFQSIYSQLPQPQRRAVSMFAEFITSNPQCSLAELYEKHRPDFGAHPESAYKTDFLAEMMAANSSLTIGARRQAAHRNSGLKGLFETVLSSEFFDSANDFYTRKTMARPTEDSGPFMQWFLERALEPGGFDKLAQVVVSNLDAMAVNGKILSDGSAPKINRKRTSLDGATSYGNSNPMNPTDVSIDTSSSTVQTISSASLKTEAPTESVDQTQGAVGMVRLESLWGNPLAPSSATDLAAASASGLNGRRVIRRFNDEFSDDHDDHDDPDDPVVLHAKAKPVAPPLTTNDTVFVDHQPDLSEPSLPPARVGRTSRMRLDYPPAYTPQKDLPVITTGDAVLGSPGVGGRSEELSDVIAELNAYQALSVRRAEPTTPEDPISSRNAKSRIGSSLNDIVKGNW